MILLTPEEMQNITDNIACSFIGDVANSGLDIDLIIHKAIARNQLKKVVEWGNELCSNHWKAQKRRECEDCWGAIIKEI